LNGSQANYLMCSLPIAYQHISEIILGEWFINPIQTIFF